MTSRPNVARRLRCGGAGHRARPPGVLVALLLGTALAVLSSGPSLAAAAAASAEPSAVTARPGSIVRWTGDIGEKAVQTCHLDDRSWAAVDNVCYLPVDLLRTDSFEAMRTLLDGRFEKLRVQIGDYPYSIQRITLQDQSRVDLSPEDLARAERESAQIAELWAIETEPRFRLPLHTPLERMPKGGRFGSKRIINGQPRSPHSGADFSAPRGTPVLAAEAGTVVLADEHFFAGNSVFVDHGGGLITMYFHLDEILVRQGDSVARGAKLATVGSTGRATGPHLHFGARWHGARVDPALLLGSPASLTSAP